MTSDTFLGRKLVSRGVGSFDLTTDCGNFYLRRNRETGSYEVQLLVGGLPIWELHAPSVMDAEDQMRQKVAEVARAVSPLHKSLEERAQRIREKQQDEDEMDPFGTWRREG